MNFKKAGWAWLKSRGGSIALFFALWSAVSCGGDAIHQGRPPFSFLERSPVGFGNKSARLESVVISSHELEAGDIVAFWMGHDEALGYLRRGVIQKVPYELFQYGHLALIVESPDHSGEKRLLQVAMGQAVNVDEGLDYLDGKQWNVFRPPVDSVDLGRLDEFVGRVITTASDPKRAYDYGGVFGWKNAPWQPETREEIGSRYSCATLVVAALHYSGYELNSVHRGGRFDVVTPKQVVMSRGMARGSGK